MKRLRASVKSLMLLVTLAVHVQAASKEDAAGKSHLLAGPVRPLDQAEVEHLFAEDNVYHNLNALRNLRIIGNTESLAGDLKDFPYLIRFINRQDADRTEDEIMGMDLSSKAENASIKLYGLGGDALDRKEYALGIHYLLLSELAGDETAGKILSSIFKDPAKRGVEHLFKPSKRLGSIYERRGDGFKMLRHYQYSYSVGRPSRGSITSAGSEHSDASTGSTGSRGASDGSANAGCGAQKRTTVL